MNDKVNEHYFGDLADQQTLRCRDRIHWNCRQAQGKRVLDLGCSQGITSITLAREGFECTGLDNDEQALEFFRKELAKEPEPVRNRIAVQLGDAACLQFEDGSFDTVILGEVLEHLTHHEQVLEQAWRVLTEKGRIVVTVPHGLNAYHDHKRSYYPLSLLELLRPRFRRINLLTMEGYIYYCGIRDSTYVAGDIPGREQLQLCMDLEKEL